MVGSEIILLLWICQSIWLSLCIYMHPTLYFSTTIFFPKDCNYISIYIVIHASSFIIIIKNKINNTILIKQLFFFIDQIKHRIGMKLRNTNFLLRVRLVVQKIQIIDFWLTSKKWVNGQWKTTLISWKLIFFWRSHFPNSSSNFSNYTTICSIHPAGKWFIF